MILATKTLQAIDSALELDGGAKFRGLLKQATLEMSDAFDDRVDMKPRSHLGCSLIGRKCARELWYGFHWVHYEKFPARILLLFNRGHLEEARFVAQLRLAGMTVWSMDSNGKQFRVSAHHGHFGGALDAVVKGCPDIPGEPILSEFKTHGAKSFAKLVKEGVEKAKPEHYAQMNQYMGFYNLRYALYAAVEKDTDHRHFEIVPFNKENYEMFLDRGGRLVFAEEPPPRIAATPSWFDCKFCSKAGVCHNGEPVEKNCRTCHLCIPGAGDYWVCKHPNHPKKLDSAEQFAGCEDYLLNSKI